MVCWECFDLFCGWSIRLHSARPCTLYRIAAAAGGRAAVSAAEATGRARLLWAKLAEEDRVAAVEMAAIAARLRPRATWFPVTRSAMRRAAQEWSDRLPTLGRLSLDIDLSSDRLRIREVRIGGGKGLMDGWQHDAAEALAVLYCHRLQVAPRRRVDLSNLPIATVSFTLSPAGSSAAVAAMTTTFWLTWCTWPARPTRSPRLASSSPRPPARPGTGLARRRRCPTAKAGAARCWLRGRSSGRDRWRLCQAMGDGGSVSGRARLLAPVP